MRLYVELYDHMVTWPRPWWRDVPGELRELVLEAAAEVDRESNPEAGAPLMMMLRMLGATYFVPEADAEKYFTPEQLRTMHHGGA